MTHQLPPDDAPVYVISIAAELAGMIGTDMAQAQEVRFNLRRPFWRSRLPEAFARLLSPLL